MAEVNMNTHEGHGRGHWIFHKVTALINLVTGLWALYNLVIYELYDHANLAVWLERDLNRYTLALMVASMGVHALMGSQVIIEDYIHHKAFKAFKIWSQRIFIGSLALLAIYSII